MQQQAIQSVTELSHSISLLFCIALILLLLAGFLCIEIGSIQKKNTMNTAIKSVVSICIVFCTFYIFGYSLMSASEQSGGYIGDLSFFLNASNTSVLTNFLLFAALCCVSVALIAGGVAERCKFLPFVLIVLAMSLLIYPVYGHWVWGSGWLTQMGFHDFAGASVIHLTGACVALAGIRKLDPRTSRIDQRGALVEVFTTNAPMYALGMIIILIGWFGIMLAMPSSANGKIIIMINTLVAASFGGLISLLSTWAYQGIANLKSLYIGIVAGLVAVSASADVIQPESAMILGIIVGIIVPLSSSIVEQLKLDDATDVIAAHGITAIIGIILVPILITPESLELHNKNLEQPLTTYKFFLTQCLGVGVCLLWSFITGSLMWKLIESITIFHLKDDEIKIGLNYTEHMTTEPLQDLNTAVDLVRKEQILEAKEHFDRLENSDLEGLSAALRELLNREHRDI